MNGPVPGSDDWLHQIWEPTLDPERPIIDPHHHLWKKRFGRNYLLEDLWVDTASGHRIEKTVFVECHAFYLREGPEHMRPTGETAFISTQAEQSAKGAPTGGPAHVAAIVAHADLTLAREPAKLTEVLDAHDRLSKGLLRGIRHAAAKDDHPEDLLIVLPTQADLYQRDDFRHGLRLLGRRGLSYDAWHYHHQNQDFCRLARAVPDTTMVLDHFGTPLGVGKHKGRRAEIFHQWKQDIAEIAKCPNVVAKLGGLAMPDNGFGWESSDKPPGSDELVAAQREYYLHAIDCFGPERCMFESNFPVDRLSVSYQVIWNAFKKMTADFSEAEKQAMFYGTAARIYRL